MAEDENTSTINESESNKKVLEPGKKGAIIGGKFQEIETGYKAVLSGKTQKPVLGGEESSTMDC